MREDLYIVNKELQCVEIDDSLMTVPEFPHNWMYNGDSPENAYFEMKISCKALLLIFKDSGETNVGKADVWVDHRILPVCRPTYQ